MSDLRTTVAALAASGVLEHGRNRERVAEAAGLRPHTGGGATPAGGSWVHPLLLALLGEERKPARLDGEDRIQAEIRWKLDAGTRAGRWAITPVMVYNEVLVRSASRRELRANPGLLPWHERQVRGAKIEGARTRDMGRRKGCPDLLLIDWRGPRFGLAEVKTAVGRLSDEQELWRDCCEAHGIDWALVTGWPDTERALRVWGWL